jgi:hypothetical protein
VSAEDAKRAGARALAAAALERGQPLAWFEELYAGAGGEPGAIPGADLEPNPTLVAWLGRRCALKVGYGLGAADELRGLFTLRLAEFEDFLDDEDPPVRRLPARYVA